MKTVSVIDDYLLSVSHLSDNMLYNFAVNVDRISPYAIIKAQAVLRHLVNTQVSYSYDDKTKEHSLEYSKYGIKQHVHLVWPLAEDKSLFFTVEIRDVLVYCRMDFSRSIKYNMLRESKM